MSDMLGGGFCLTLTLTLYYQVWEIWLLRMGVNDDEICWCLLFLKRFPHYDLDAEMSLWAKSLWNMIQEARSDLCWNNSTIFWHIFMLISSASQVVHV